MNVRNCPSCNAELGSYDGLFCSVCGQQLPDELVRSSASYVSEVPLNFELDKRNLVVDTFREVTKKVLHIINIKAVLAAVVIPLGLFGLYMFVLRDSGLTKLYVKPPVAAIVPAVHESTDSQPETDHTVSVSSTIKSGTFTSGEAAKYIPFEADFVVEVSDFETFGQLFSTFDPGYSPVFQGIKDSVFPGFAFFGIALGDDYQYGGVFFIRNITEFDTAVFLDFPWVKYKTNGNVLFISTSDALALEFESVSLKLSKSLSLNPKFREKEKNMPETGRVSIYVLNARGKEQLKVFSDNWPREYKDLFDAFEKTKLDYGVVL